MTLLPSSEQTAIVSYPTDRPLRVEAGAGTGKTTTIVLRLQAAVAAGLAPEETLGLTFTNKAAGELSDRLRTALPDVSAEGREVEVATYHGFAYGLLREFGAFVGIERDVRLIGHGYVRELIHQELANGSDYVYLDLTSPPTRVNEVAALMRSLADNLVAPDALLTESRPDDDVAGKRWELAAVVRRVQAAKLSLGLIDYGDLVRHVYNLLADNPSIAKRIAGRYKMVLLDEYQDTDPAQREMLRLIFRDGFALTAVGDPDQTIYEWRGASLSNFRDFPEHFPDPSGEAAMTLPLTANRRSAPIILDHANAIRELLYGPEKFSPLRPAGIKPGALTVARHHSASDEAVAIAQELVRLATEEDVAWQDMAVLFRKNAQIPLVRDALEAFDVPYEVAALGGLLSVPVVADLRAWLELLADPSKAPALLRILLGGPYRLGLADLRPLTVWIGTGRQVAEDDNAGRSILEAIDELESVSGLSPAAVPRLERFGTIYRRLLIAAQGLSLVELARRVLDDTDAWAEIDAMAPNASLTARLNLYRFLDLAEEWSPLQGRPSLAAFLGYLETLDEDTTSQELDTARVGDENVVPLLTIHRAKGLEWDVVFIPAVVTDTLPARYRGGDNPFKTPAALPHELRLDQDSLPKLTGTESKDRSILSSRHLEQELRTAYVGVTRAKSRLYLSGAHWYTEKRPKQISSVMEAALALPDAVIEKFVEDPGDPPATLRLQSPLGSPDPVFPDGWQAALRAASEDIDSVRHLAGDHKAYDDAMDQTRLALESLPQPAGPDESMESPNTSVTGLVTLAGCPQQYYWSEVDPLPRRNSRAMRRGVDVHRKIELHALGQIPLWDAAGDLYDALDVPSGDLESKAPFETFLESRFAERRARFVEVPIDLKLAVGRVRGRIDAVYEDQPGVWEIVDWKSGGPSSDSTRVIQLQAYAVAAMEGLIGDQVPSQLTVTFCYLGGGSVTEVSHEVSADWLATARHSLESTLAVAVGPDFPQRPSTRCRSCDFTRFCKGGKEWLAAEDTPNDDIEPPVVDDLSS